MRNCQVAIVQDYVPKFRLAFFSGLVERLRSVDIDAVIVAGSPTGTQASRGDAAGQAVWQRQVEPRRSHLKPFNVPFYGTARNWQECDGVIFPLRGNSIDLNVELLKRPITHRRVGAWGHVGAYIKEGNRLDTMVERYQMRMSDHIFAYTESGARLAIKSGASPNKVTAVMNSTDVSDTLAASASITDSEVDDFAGRHRLTRGKTFGYVGGIDAAKRISFLVDALDILWERDSEVRLLVGGQGEQEHLLDAASQRGQVVRLGHAGPHEKALIHHLAEGVLNPGRIGLLAVECMAMGLPILTTDWQYHAPEFEYLVEGRDVFLSPGSPARFVDLVLSHTSDGRNVRGSQAVAYPKLDTMIRNFADGVEKMMSSKPL